jgi:hypothetical protein
MPTVQRVHSNVSGGRVYSSGAVNWKLINGEKLYIAGYVK